MWCRMFKGGVCSYRLSRDVFVALDERDGPAYVESDVQVRCM
jgi:hypothetical protein